MKCGFSVGLPRHRYQEGGDEPKRGYYTEDAAPNAIAPLASPAHPVEIGPGDRHDPGTEDLSIEPLAAVPTPMRHGTVVGDAAAFLERLMAGAGQGGPIGGGHAGMGQAGRPSPPHDHHRAFGVRCDIFAYRADEQTRHFTMSPRPHHDEAGV